VADGTPDPGPDNRVTDCNSASNIVSSTGSRGACISARGAVDMAGNLEEWVQKLGAQSQGGATPAAPRAALGTSPTAWDLPEAATPRKAMGAAPSAERPPGFPDAVWNNALRSNGNDPRRAAAMLNESNKYAP
jgi:hypothetical protein